MVKRSIAIIILICFLLINLPVQESVSAASHIDISKPVELKWYVIGPGDQPDISKVETAVNKYLKDKINASLNLTTFYWSDYENKMMLLIAAGEPYDINFTAYWMINYNKYAKYGIYVDLNELIDDYAPKTKALLGENVLKVAEVEGKLYALPTYNTSLVNSYGILLNKKLVQKYKIDTSKIKKLQDLESTFKTIKTKEPKIINFHPFDTSGNNSIYDTLNYDNLFSDSIIGAVLRDGKSTKVINNFDTAEAKSLFALMNKWYKAGYINKSSTNPDFFKSNKSNIFAMYSSINSFTAENLLLNEKVEMIPIELTKPVLAKNNITGSMQAISSMSKNPERALMLLELVNTDEKLSNMLKFGIEGTHYKKTGAKTISQLPAGIEKYNPALTWQLGNESISYSLPGHSPKLWDNFKGSVSNAVASPLLGFTFDSEAVKTQIPKLESIVKKYYRDLSMGKLDPNVNLPKMNNELKNAGLQKVLSEMQKQVDNFLKADY